MQRINKLLDVRCLLMLSFSISTTSIQAEPLPEQARQKLFEKDRVSLFVFEQEASAETTSSKINGVKFAIKVNTGHKNDANAIEVIWTISYSGPRPPLILIKPSLELATRGQTKVIFYAFARGKKYGFPLVVASPTILTEKSGRQVLVGPFSFEKRELSRPLGSSLAPSLRRTKDWFITASKGESANGAIMISVKDLKKSLMKKFPGEFDSNKPPRLFTEVIHHVEDRGEDFGLDAWIGELFAPYNKVPPLKKW